MLANIKKTTIVIAWWFWFEFYWLNFLIISIFIYVMLATLDSLLWYSIARKMKWVSSKQWDPWFERKMSQVIVMLIIVISCSSLANEVDYIPLEIALWAIAFIPILWFSFWQITSVIENMAVNAHWKELRFINLLLKLAWIWQAKLEEKLKKYNIDVDSTKEDSNIIQ